MGRPLLFGMVDLICVRDDFVICSLKLFGMSLRRSNLMADD